MNLEGKLWLTMGINGSGKSYLNKRLIQVAANNGNNVGVFDPTGEYPENHPNIYRVVPTQSRGKEGREQLGMTIDELVKPDGSQAVPMDYFVIDEISRYHNSSGTLTGPIGEAVDLRRHWNVGVGMIARRPVQIHADIRGLADFCVIFNLYGANDIRLLNNWINGLGDDVASLNEYSFVVVNKGGDYEIYDPI